MNDGIGWEVWRVKRAAAVVWGVWQLVPRGRLGVLRRTPSLAVLALLSCPLALAQTTPDQLVDNLRTNTFRGRPIDLDFVDTDIRVVLARLEDESGMSFDLDPRVRDLVSVRLHGVPWDEVLDRLLAEHRLTVEAFDHGLKITRGPPRAVLAFDSPAKARLAAALYKYAIPVAVTGLAGIFSLLLVRTIRRRRQPRVRPLLDDDRAEEVMASLRRTMTEDQAYRDDGLTLQKLAGMLEVTPHQLSWLLNRRAETSFVTLVNRCRLDEVKRRLADPTESASILQIAFDAGFGTKGAFNRIFKTATGMTPSEFRSKAAAGKL